MKQTLLPNGCWISPFSVLPKNWKSSKKSMVKDWMIYYRFYDPSVKGPDDKIRPKLVRIKGMNRFTDWDQRIASTEFLMEEELNMLTKLQYNPIARQVTKSRQIELTENSPLLPALEVAVEKMEVLPRVKEEARNYLVYVGMSMTLLGFEYLPLREVKSRHMAAVYSHLKENIADINRMVQEKYPERRIKAKAEFTPAKFNRYRAYIQMIFKVLEKGMHLIEENPIGKVQKMKKVKKIRQVLTNEERKKLNDHLWTFNREFYRFVHIFFHSGSRETELLSLQGKDVDIQRQVFRCIVRKRTQGPVEVERPIKDIALPLWKEVMEKCGRDHYVFSNGLVPGETQLDTNQLNKRWRKWVKKELGIEASLYSLKHLHTTEAVDRIGEELAARMNAHTTTAMVCSIYDVKSKSRSEEIIKKLGNAL